LRLFEGDGFNYFWFKVMYKMRLILLFAIVIVFISSLPGGQAEDVAEATKSPPKEAGLLGLDGPLDQLDLTKMLAESFEAEEQEGSEETSPSGDAVEEAEPVEESTEEAGDTEHVLSQEESETESDAEAEPAEPEWLQHRIDRFTRKLRLAEEERDELEREVQSLKSQVEQVPAAVQQNGNPVAHIRSERELNDIASLAERRLEFAEEMEDRLLDNPEAVEKTLRQQGVSRKEQVVRG
jgi:flagellar biosynthesis GTPase FlhF